MSTDDAVLQRFATAAPSEQPDAVVVDWERTNKTERQAMAAQVIGIDTTFRPDDDQAVGRVRAMGFDRVVCRIDAVGPHTAAQIDALRAQGGTDVLVPMWRHIVEVEHVLAHADGLRVGVMVESLDAVRNAALLGHLGVSFAFVGLMDLALERRTSSIFAPLVDGTLDTIVERLGDIPFGFGGLTMPGAGRPVPDRLLVSEMLRLGASFSFMRRSFLESVGGGVDAVDALRAIRAGLRTMGRRSEPEIDSDRRELRAMLDGPFRGN